MTDVLVTLDHDAGTAAVIRDADGLWLTDDVDRRGGTRLDDHRPRVQGLDEELWICAGVLPQGAERAVVIDAVGAEVEAVVGEGAWLALVGGPPELLEPPVRYHAANGSLVPTRPPADWPHEPVDDADTPCPACGQVAWEAYRALDDSRGGSEDEDGNFTPATVVVCRRCGHEEISGTFFGLEVPDDDTDDEAMQAAWLAEQQKEERRILSAARFFPLRAGRWAGANGQQLRRTDGRHGRRA